MFLNQHLSVRVLVRKYYTVQAASILPVSCNDIVTLTALLVNLDGSEYTDIVVAEWEQLSGTEVAWLEPVNQIETTFQQPGIKDDKVFRLHLYKNTPSYTYKDILVTAVPTDFIDYYNFNSVDQSYNSFAFLSIENMGPMFSDTNPLDTRNQTGGFDKISATVNIDYYIPNTQNYPITLSVYSVVNGVTTLEQSIQIPDQFYKIIQVYDLYPNRIYYAVLTVGYFKSFSEKKSYIYDGTAQGVAQREILLAEDIIGVGNTSYGYMSYVDSLVFVNITAVDAEDEITVSLYNSTTSEVQSVNMLTIANIETDDETVDFSVGNHQTSEVTFVVAYQYSTLG